MTLEKFKNTFKLVATMDKDIKSLYDEISKFINSLDETDFCAKFKAENKDFVYYFDVWFDNAQKNQKRTLFLISKYNKDRSILFESFRLDITVEEKVDVQLIIWKKTDDDYVTKTKNIILNKQELTI